MFKNKANKAQKAAINQPVAKQDYFNNCHRTYSCVHCRAHLANHDELISKLFQGNHGRAYLFNKVVNIGCKPAVQRELLTGLHAVADIYCDSCETTLGWKYEQAFVPSQKYKEGKYIIELAHMVKENNWDLTSYNAHELLEEVKSVGTSKRDELLGFSNFNRSFEIGGESRFPLVGSSSLDGYYSTREDKRDHSEATKVSTELGEELRANGSKKREKVGAPVEVEEEVVEANKLIQIPSFICTENSEKNAELTETGIKSDEIELLESSLNKIHVVVMVTNQDNNNCFQTNTTNDNESLSASPNNSLCSSRSHSDLSHSSVMSATYSSTNEETNEDRLPQEVDVVRQQCIDRTLPTDNNSEDSKSVADEVSKKSCSPLSLVCNLPFAAEHTLNSGAL